MVQGTQAGMARPTSVTVAAWILIVLGAIVTLAGLFLVIASGALAGLLGPLAGLGIVAAIIAIVIGVLHIWSGIAILGGKNWARIVGIVLGALGVLFGVLGLVAAFTTPAVTDPTTGATVGGPGSAITPVIQIVIYGFVLWALMRAGSWFTR